MSVTLSCTVGEKSRWAYLYRSRLFWLPSIEVEDVVFTAAVVVPKRRRVATKLLSRRRIPRDLVTSSYSNLSSIRDSITRTPYPRRLRDVGYPLRSEQ